MDDKQRETAFETKVFSASFEDLTRNELTIQVNVGKEFRRIKVYEQQLFQDPTLANRLALEMVKNILTTEKEK